MDKLIINAVDGKNPNINFSVSDSLIQALNEADVFTTLHTIRDKLANFDDFSGDDLTSIKKAARKGVLEVCDESFHFGEIMNELRAVINEMQHYQISLECGILAECSELNPLHNLRVYVAGHFKLDAISLFYELFYKRWFYDYVRNQMLFSDESRIESGVGNLIRIMSDKNIFNMQVYEFVVNKLKEACELTINRNSYIRY